MEDGWNGKKEKERKKGGKGIPCCWFVGHANGGGTVAQKKKVRQLNELTVTFLSHNN